MSMLEDRMSQRHENQRNSHDFQLEREQQGELDSLKHAQNTARYALERWDDPLHVLAEIVFSYHADDLRVFNFNNGKRPQLYGLKKNCILTNFDVSCLLTTPTGILRELVREENSLPPEQVAKARKAIQKSDSPSCVSEIKKALIRFGNWDMRDVTELNIGTADYWNAKRLVETVDKRRAELNDQCSHGPRKLPGESHNPLYAA